MFFLLNSIALLYVLSFSYLFKIFILIFVIKENKSTCIYLLLFIDILSI